MKSGTKKPHIMLRELAKIYKRKEGGRREKRTERTSAKR